VRVVRVKNSKNVVVKMNDEYELKNIALISDVLIQVRAVQNLLISKNIITQDELTKEINLVSRMIARSMLESVNVTGDVDKILDEMMGGKSEPTT